jgi:hypothetical protein
MKSPALFVLLFLICLKVSAQTWPQPGAIWNYNFLSLMYGGHVEIKHTGDTTLKGHNCSVLTEVMVLQRQSGPNTETIIGPASKIFMYEDGAAVYWYTRDSFYKLYDFNAQLGDTMFFPAPFTGSSADCRDFGRMVVSDTGTANIGGRSLRYYSMSPVDSASWGIQGRIYERMGPEDYMFPKPIFCKQGTDPDFIGPMVCYKDDSFIPGKDCEFVSSLEDERKPSLSISIYPNPAQDKLYLSGLQEMNLRASVYDLTGRRLLNKPMVEMQSAYIDISGIPAGVYFLQISSGNMDPQVLQFVKQ